MEYEWEETTECESPVPLTKIVATIHLQSGAKHDGSDDRPVKVTVSGEYVPVMCDFGLRVRKPATEKLEEILEKKFFRADHGMYYPTSSILCVCVEETIIDPTDSI